MATLTPHAFVAKWRKVTLKESAATKEHFLDLCSLLGHPTPAAADAEGTHFTFEYGAAKLGGGQGFADVFKRGFFGWEYKGKHANLDRAYLQLLQYRAALHNPPLLVVSDIETIVIHPNFVNRANTPTTLTLDDLLTPAGLERLRAVFYHPTFFETAETPEMVTRRVAEEFARLADLLRADGHEPLAIAHFLIRLLFCLFAEDVGLLPEGLFGRLVTRTRAQPAAFAGQLSQLFAAMTSGGWFGAEPIPHVNGGLFDNAAVLPLSAEGLDVLARVAGADWSAIDATIFGTLFERGLDPAKRSQLGAHYTSREDILLIVEPVLMAPLRRRWASVQAQAQGLAAQRDQAKGPKRAGLQRKLQDLLLDFATELARVSVLDPAAGSGNFLYLALLSLLDLWKAVYDRMLALGLTPVSPLEGIAPSPGQLYGIEINPYAHELAQATIWIGYIQWLRSNGFGAPPEPILKPIQTVRRMDAILAYDAAGQPVEPAWPQADVIIGNPPFLGGGKIRSELGDAYTQDLFKLYGDRLPNFSDLVCYWFEKARAMIETGRAKRAGLLATQGIRGGANRTVLERIKQTGDIFWAQSDRDWVLDGATVHVSMVGFDNGHEQIRVLDGQAVEMINSDLTKGVDLTTARLLSENRNISFVGPSPKAPFDIEFDEAQTLLARPINVNGRPNSDIVRPVVSAIDLVQNGRHKWTIDFGMMDIDEASQYEAPFEFVRQHILPVRASRRDDYRGQWWQYARPRPEMRTALKGKVRFIATPRVSKHRVFVWLSETILANDGTVVFAADSDYVFGVLHSRLHELWARRMGTQLREAESGFRYTPTTCFETFPFPWPPGQEPGDDGRVQAIAAAAQELVRLRDAWLNPPGASEAELKKRTLTNLYNQRPTWLDQAHKRLDAAVLAAYGWPADLDDEQILARLLALNLARRGG
ncbi:class I SAM-dependent DNA methyltransferase [Candidatus Amarolinea aalborgensis]|uniref:class I SAM-dependent DNA methyltransferase n=1 Tax=Candidatus Amarolinea aalborgensis TaxID=2249329 RepID=UPI003BF9C5B8